MLTADWIYDEMVDELHVYKKFRYPVHESTIHLSLWDLSHEIGLTDRLSTRILQSIIRMDKNEGGPSDGVIDHEIDQLLIHDILTQGTPCTIDDISEVIIISLDTMIVVYHKEEEVYADSDQTQRRRYR